MKKTLKFLHEVGTVGVTGAVAAQFILSHTADGLPLDEYVAARQQILLLTKWLLLPARTRIHSECHC